MDKEEQQQVTIPENPLDMLNSGHTGERRVKNSEKTPQQDTNEDYSFDDLEGLDVQPFDARKNKEEELANEDPPELETDEEAQQEDVNQSDDTTQQQPEGQQQESQQEEDLKPLTIVQPTVDNPENPDKRDYSKYLSEDAELLKKVPNHVYDQVKQRFEDFKAKEDKLKEYEQKQVPDSFYENPEAYKLTDSYKQAEQQANVTSILVDHYKNELNKLDTGEDITVFAGFNEQGQPITRTIQAVEIKNEYGEVIGKKHQASMQGILIQEMTKYSNQLEQQSAVMNQVKQQFTGSYSQVVEGIKKTEQQLFPDTDVDDNYKKNMQAMHNHLPQQFRNHPLAGLVTKGYAAYVKMFNALKEENNKLKQQLGLKSTKQNDQARAGVTTSTTKAGQAGKKKSGDFYNVDEFM